MIVYVFPEDRFKMPLKVLEDIILELPERVVVPLHMFAPPMDAILLKLRLPLNTHVPLTVPSPAKMTWPLNIVPVPTILVLEPAGLLNVRLLNVLAPLRKEGLEEFVTTISEPVALTVKLVTLVVFHTISGFEFGDPPVKVIRLLSIISALVLALVEVKPRQVTG